MNTPLTVKLRRIDKTLPLPTYHTPGATCFDLTARVDTTIDPHAFGRIPLNVAIAPPKDHWVLLAVRSSTHKTGLIPANGLGIMDEDFAGDNDEYQLLVFNTTDKPVTVERGTRIAQATVLPKISPVIEEVEHLEQADRGGVGSTGER